MPTYCDYTFWHNFPLVICSCLPLHSWQVLIIHPQPNISQSPPKHSVQSVSLSSLARCGLQWPHRKSRGFWMTHGTHKQCGQWSSPRRSGRWGLFLYSFGWLGWLSYNYTSPALIMCRHKKVYSPFYLVALVPVLALDPTPHLLYYRVVGCPERRRSS